MPFKSLTFNSSFFFVHIKNIQHWISWMIPPRIHTNTVHYIFRYVSNLGHISCIIFAFRSLPLGFMLCARKYTYKQLSLSKTSQKKTCLICQQRFHHYSVVDHFTLQNVHFRPSSLWITEPCHVWFEILLLLIQIRIYNA